MQQTHRFIRVDNPTIVCYDCEIELNGVAYADLYGPRMVYLCEPCALKREPRLLGRSDTGDSAA
jgi:hypothetical protein